MIPGAGHPLLATPLAKVTKKFDAKTKVSPPRRVPFEAKDRNARGQNQGHRRKCSTKKKSSKVFSRRSTKKDLQNFFRRFPIEGHIKGLRKFSARFLEFSNKILTVQKKVLSLSRGQGNFGGLEAFRPRPRT